MDKLSKFGNYKRGGEECSHSTQKRFKAENDESSNISIKIDPQRVREYDSFASESGKYSTSAGLKSTLHGSLYQLRLLILFMQRGLKNGYDFRLATEMKAAEKFDDLVFQYSKVDNAGNIVYEYIFLQAKHKKDESKEISYEDLSTESFKDDFGLPKYFYSYRMIKQRPEFSKGNIRNLILCTDINFNFDDLRKEGIDVKEVTEPDDFLDVKTEGKVSVRYRLTVNAQHKLYEKLRDTSELHKLGKALVKHIESKRKLTVTDIFAYYHTALIYEKIIVIEEWECKKGIKKYIGKFSESFINLNPQEPMDPDIGLELSESAKKLRTILQQQLNIKGLSIDKETELNLSRTFGKGFELNHDPWLTNVEEFAQEVVSYLECAKEDKVCTIDKRKQVIRDNIDKLAGHVLVKKEKKVKFSLNFLDDDGNLSANLGAFKQELKRQLTKEQIDLSSLPQYEFKIKDFLTCEEEELHSKMKLPEDYIDDEEIKDFFDKLIFAVNLPNVDELGRILKDEIGEVLNLMDSDLLADRIQREMLDWFKENGKKSRFFTSKEGNNLLKSTKQKIYKFMALYSTKDFQAKIKKLGIQFTQDSLDELKLGDFLSASSTMQVFFLMTDHIRLSAIKLNQIVENIPEYKKDNSFIYISLSSLLCLKDCVLEAFKLSTSNLLVVECGEIVKEDIYGISRDLYEIINSEANITKKILFLTMKGNDLPRLFQLGLKSKQYQETVDMNSSFINLTYKSQVKLLQEGKLFLQGHEVSLSALIDRTSKSKELIDSEMLVRLVSGEEINIGNNVPVSGGYDKDTYVNRTFNRIIKPLGTYCLEEDKRIYLMEINDTDKDILYRLGSQDKILNLVDDENDHNSNIPIEFIILDQRELEEQHPGFYKQISGDRIGFWIKTKSAKCKLESNDSVPLVQQCPIDVRSIRPKLNIEITLNCSEEDLLVHLYQEYEVLVISDTAGMGKSTVLSSLGNGLKEIIDPVWIVRLDLNNYTGVFKKEKERKVDLDFAIEFLVDTQQMNCRTNFEKRLFESSLKTQSSIKIVLLFDGFDEISPDYKDIVIDLLKVLQKSHAVLFLTTRPNMKLYLQERLSAKVYTLEPLSECSKVQYLVKFWRKKLGIDNLTQIRRYAEALIDKFNKSVNDEEKKHFTGNPLQMRMLAEIYQENREEIKEWQGCKEFITAFYMNREPILPKELCLLDLYEWFAEKKFYDHFLQEKGLMDLTKPTAKDLAEANYNEFKINHGILALHRLGLTKLLTEEETQKLHRLIKDIENGKHNMGIVDQVIDEKPHFLHLTFAEYFASVLVVGKLYSHHTIVLTCINNVISNTSLVFITSIVKLLSENQRKFESLLQGKTLVNLAAQEGCLDLVEVLLKAGHEDFPKPDCLKKTPLHYAAEYGHEEIAKILNFKHQNHFLETPFLEHICFEVGESPYPKLEKFLNKKDHHGNTALHYAALNGNSKIVRHLLLKGADRLALNESVKEIIQPIVEELKLQVSTLFQRNKWYIYPRFLSNFYKHGCVRVVEALFRRISEEDRNRILNTDYNGQKPLDFVNSSFKLSDDERLKISQYLVRNNTILVSKINDAMKILIAAARSGHVKTLAHFIDIPYYSPLFVASELLYEACSCNQLNIIKLLFDKYGSAIECEGNTAIHAAADSGAGLRIVKFIIDSGHNVNAVNNKGETALLPAAYRCNLNLIKCLVNHGADVNMHDDEGNTPLSYAFKYDQEDIIKYLVRECGAGVATPSDLMKKKIHFYQNLTKFNMDHVDEHGMPRLHRALQFKDFEWSKFVIQHGANIHMKDQTGRTPLHWASEGQCAEIVELLLQYGAVYNEVDLSNRTPRDLVSGSIDKDKIIWILHVLDILFNIQNFMKDFAEWLLGGKWGPYGTGHTDVWDNDFPIRYILNVRNASGKTLVHVAADTNDAQAIQVLLKYNQDCIYRKAITTNKINKIYKAYQPLSIDAKDFDGNTPFHLAAAKGYDRIVYILLQNGAVFNAKNSQNETPEDLANISKPLCHNVIELLKPTKDLFHAIEQNILTEVRTLIDKKVCINSKDAYGRTHLHRTTNCNNQIIHHWTPLHLAAASGHLAILLYLITEGADMECVDIDGRTPLHVAVAHNNIKIVKLLLKNGAIFNAQDKEGKAPFEIVVNKCSDLLKSIDKLFKDIQSDNPLRILQTDLRTLEADYEIDINIIINAFDKEGNTLIHYAAKFNCLDVINFLLQNGAIFNAEDKFQCTFCYFTYNYEANLLFKSLQQLFEEISPKECKVNDVKIIINVRIDRGMTLMHKAAACGKLHVVEWLVDRGANVNARDKSGWTPLYYAAENGMQDVVQLLIKKGADVNREDDNGAGYNDSFK